MLVLRQTNFGNRKKEESLSGVSLKRSRACMPRTPPKWDSMTCMTHKYHQQKKTI